MQNACKAAGVQFWANVESFKINGGVFGPCAAARLKQQMAAVAPFVDGMVTFDFVHYMNTAAFLSSWNAARRTAMKQLYADYLHGCVEADYTPFAAPSLNACLDGKGLTLKWRGLSGDQFQADFKTNLAQLDWTPVNTPVWAADSEFSLNEVAPPGPQGSYFRVQRLPRLQPPDTLLFVPPGNFQMGTPTNELNRTPVELKPFSVTFTQGFWIGQFEVTQSEYQNVACTNPAPLSGDLEYPAANVSWSNAVSYCELLTRRERQAGRLPAGYAYRLPTEAEWEYAARAGSTNRFGFGDDLSLLSAYAWFSGNSHGAAHAVGQLQPNLWGLNDIQGNVAEWCLDWINPAPTGPVTDYRGSITNSMHAIRGGAWSLSGTTCRLGWRSGVSAAARSPEIGFRIVLAPADP